MSAPSPSPAHGAIRFEDLGEPVQRLIKSLKGDVTEEDYALLEFVSVKDMAKIYSEMATDRHAEEIWKELRASLAERKEKAARRERDLAARQQELDQERAEEERRQREQEEEERREQRAAEEQRRRRQEERERRQQQEVASAEAAARAEQEAAEAAEEAAREEERRQKAERKRKRREARARELQEEQEALEAEKAKQLAKRKRNQKKDWFEYVDSHPLEFKSGAEDGEVEIAQKKLRHTLNAPPRVSEALLFRTYTPKCPECGTRFTQPPSEWLCPTCLRRTRDKVLVWQPDSDSTTCMCCKGSLGRWSRHHCRSCGRLVCTNCAGNRAIIAPLGFHTPVKVCDQCALNKPVHK